MQPLLNHNIELNDLCGRCRAETLEWGRPPPLEWGRFDAVLAADVIYPTKEPACLLALRDTILAACPLGSSTALVLAYHERAREDLAFLDEELLPHFDVTVVELSEGGTSCRLFV